MFPVCTHYQFLLSPLFLYFLANTKEENTLYLWIFSGMCTQMYDEHCVFVSYRATEKKGGVTYIFPFNCNRILMEVFFWKPTVFGAQTSLAGSKNSTSSVWLLSFHFDSFGLRENLYHVLMVPTQNWKFKTAADFLERMNIHIYNHILP